MLRQRLLVALILIPLFLAALFLLPQWAWAVLLGIVVLLAAHEWARLSGFAGRGAWAYLALTTLILFGCYRLLETGPTLTGWLAVAATLFWLAVVPFWLALGWRGQAWPVRALTGWLLLLPTWVAMLELRLVGPGLVLFIMGLIWLADSAAYFAGHRFGRHKLAPLISPGKTWEGVLGAVLAGMLLAWLVGVSSPNLLLAGHRVSAPVLVAACVFLVAVSVEGDLFESHIKRVAGVKDSSHLIPGHGGVLDRIDSQTAALPVFLLLAFAYLGRLGN
ncbi:phosphatidate cytidylyltransferase [Thiobacter aerophilum]|uniref:Phosphatidate cytidylyltransferase n=1 Tax=Thiobacter aerophilum TaxID=3121275 RepID=A0ABV0EAL9_9BURK